MTDMPEVTTIRCLAEEVGSLYLRNLALAERLDDKNDEMKTRLREMRAGWNRKEEYYKGLVDKTTSLNESYQEEILDHESQIDALHILVDRINRICIDPPFNNVATRVSQAISEWQSQTGYKIHFSEIDNDYEKRKFDELNKIEESLRQGDDNEQD